jgi:hypothetical protein
MDSIAWWTAAQFTAIAAWATVVIYIALGIFALIQVLQGRTLREHQARLARESQEEQARLSRESQAEQARQAQELREEQARPFVVVDFETVGLLFFLTVENVGRTIARNVVIGFDKPLASSLERPKQLDDASLFREPIPAMAPGKKFRIPFDTLPGRRQKGLPLTYEVTLHYEGPTGRKYGKGEGYRLDMSIYDVVSAGEKGMTQLVERVEEIRKELARWTDGIRGLRVHAVDREQHERTQVRQWLIERSVDSARENGVVPAARALVRDLWRQALSRRGLR